MAVRRSAAVLDDDGAVGSGDLELLGEAGEHGGAGDDRADALGGEPEQGQSNVLRLHPVGRGGGHGRHLGDGPMYQRSR